MMAASHSQSEKLSSIPEVCVCGGSCVEYRTKPKSGLISDTAGRNVESLNLTFFGRLHDMTQEQMKNEIYYQMALAFLDRLLAEGRITEEEHKEADRLNAAGF